MIAIENLKLFGKGGKRECYVHPEHTDRCIKVWQVGREPSVLRQQATLFKRLRKSVDAFDENFLDARTFSLLENREGKSVWEHVPRFYGVEETTRGPGVVFQVIRDYDNLVSRPILDRVWEEGNDEKFLAAIDEFVLFWERHTIPTRELMLYNVVCQEFAPDKFRLYFVDGFGEKNIFPMASFSKKMALKSSARKACRFRNKIKKLIQKKIDGGCPNPLGFLVSR